MGRPLRMYSETGLYFVTARTYQSRLLLTPSPQLNGVLAGVLARAAAVTGVQLHAYVAFSNHVHLLVTAPGGALSDFMKYFLGNAARKVGRLVHWTGSLWQRRFSAEPVLDDAAAEGRLRYILAHGVKEGLVRRVEDWPGLSCLDLLRRGGVEQHRFFHWARRWKKGVLVEGGDQVWDERWAEDVPLGLEPSPAWAGLTQAQRAARVEALVRDIGEEGARQHASVKGPQAVVREDPHARPSRTKRTPRPQCHATSAAARRAYRDTYTAWTSAYVAASARFRRGDWGAQFPQAVDKVYDTIEGTP